MKKLCLAICYVFSVLLAVAQKNVKGKVVDAVTGKPVAGATIEFEKGQSYVSADNGSFSIPVQPGSYKVTVSSIGYKSKVSALQPVDVEVVFALERFDLFLQPVEIRALRAGDKSPFTKTNISKKEIEQQNLGQDLPFLLNQTPSVVVSSDAGNGVGYTGIRIRGTDPTRINVTLNGIPYNDAESQGSFFVDLPDFSSSVNSIQIQRGVGTSSNGAGAFGATINIGTNEFREDAYGEINNSYGSFNTWKHTVKGGTGLMNEHFTIDTRLSRISSDGYIDRASSSLHSFYFSAAYLTKKSSLRFNAFSGKEKTYQAWNGILQSEVAKNRTYNSAGAEKPGDPYENETDNYQQDHYQLFFNHSFNADVSFNTAFFLTRGRGYYEQYKADREYADFGLPYQVIGSDTIFSTDLIRQLWLDNYFFGNVFSLQVKKNKSQFTFGGGVNRYDGSHYGKVIWAKMGGIPYNHQWYDHHAYKNDINLYAKWQQELSASWSLYLDLQYRNVLYDIDGFRDNPTVKVHQNYNFLNPKAGIAYNNNKGWNYYFSAGMAGKEPNRDDFESGATQQPKFETLIDLETSVGRQQRNYSWSVTLYYMRYRNQLALTGKVNDVGAYTRINIPKSYRTGIELQGKFKPANWLTASGNFTYSKSRLQNFTEYIDDYDAGGQKATPYGSTPIALSPDIIASGNVIFTPRNRFDITTISKYVGRQYLDNTGNKNRSLADFFVQDLRISYTLKEKILQEATFIVQLNNVFDRKYEPNGYSFSYLYNGQTTTENYVFPMAGFNWMLGLNIKL